MTKWIFSLLPFFTFGQSFAPEPGVVGTTAIHKDSSAITFWANSVSITRGYLDISDPGLGYTSYGVESEATGQADGISVVSLGDGGVAEYTFQTPITNGAGTDFAIFENGFIDHYMELAFVEVSSNGVDFVRFDAVSEIPTDVQLSNSSTSDCRMVHNLAGKYRALYGTPFDLDELAGNSLVDINQITHIRIADVVGSIDSNWGSIDSQGNMINDPYPTPFPSGGFDLDGLALLQPYALEVSEQATVPLCYPNPAADVLHFDAQQFQTIRLYDALGNLVLTTSESPVDVHFLQTGIYLVTLESNQGILRQSIQVR